MCHQAHKSNDEEDRHTQSVSEKAVEDYLYLSVRALNCLQSENILTLNELLRKTENELLKLPNMGKTTLKEIKEELASKNLKLQDPKS